MTKQQTEKLEYLLFSRLGKMNIQIRPATQEDAPLLARSILVAGRAHVKKGIWEVVIGGTEKECLQFLNLITITTIPHLFHYSQYIIAEKGDGAPVGSLGGYDPSAFGYDSLSRAVPEVIKQLDLAENFSKNSEERSAKVLACIPRSIDGAWVIDSVATSPEHRGKGVAGKLLHAILEKGKAHGHSHAQVSMYIGNEPALKLYRKFGFEIMEEVRNPYFEEHIGSPGMLSLVSKL